jgi:hypothetical protein
MPAAEIERWCEIVAAMKVRTANRKGRKRCTTTLGDFGELRWLLRHQVPRHQFIDAFLRPAVHKACQQFGEIDLRIDAVEFARLDQRSQACPVFRAFRNNS